MDAVLSKAERKAAAEPTEAPRNSPSMLAAWLLLAAGGALFFAGRTGSLEMAHLVFFSMSIGLCAVSVFAFWVRAISSDRTVSVETSFREIFDEDDKPAAITDADCKILTINKAARKRVVDSSDHGYAGQIFAAWAHDADEVVFRLARAARDRGAASEVLNSVTPMRLSARRMRGGRLLWSMDDGAASPDLSLDEAPFGFARIDALGAVRSENPVFKTYSNAERTEIVTSARQAQEMGQGWTGVDVSGGRRVSTAVQPGELNDLNLFVFPEWAEASHSRELVFEQIPVALARLTPGGAVISVNAAARALLGPAARPGVAFDTIVEGTARGIGEQLEDVQPLPDLAILLVNPGVTVSTPAIFQALKIEDDTPSLRSFDAAQDREGFILALQEMRNDLEPSAVSLVPQIADVLEMLGQLESALLSRMSGSGATCFALFRSLDDAKDAEKNINARFADWWTFPSVLRE